MLVLSRKLMERIVLNTSDGPIVIVLVDAKSGGGRLGIDAPAAVTVNREEVLPLEARPPRLAPKVKPEPKKRATDSLVWDSKQNAWLPPAEVTA